MMISKPTSAQFLTISLTLFSLSAAAQTASTAPTQSSTTRPRTSQTTGQSGAAKQTPPATQTESGSQTPATATTTRKSGSTGTDDVQTRAVRAAFDTLVDGIRKADAKAVMGVYWNSPLLVLFNNNGTVTKSWEQVRQNRESLYAKVSDVKLDVRDVNIRLLGTSAAVVTAIWEQTQTADGQAEHATGRLTLVFQKTPGGWKAVHAHTSPDRPDPSRLLPSERTATPEPTPAKP